MVATFRNDCGKALQESASHDVTIARQERIVLGTLLHVAIFTFKWVPGGIRSLLPQHDIVISFPVGLVPWRRLECRARIESSWPVRERCLDPKNAQRRTEDVRPMCDCGSRRC
jgi:hypothetical protein